METDSEVEERGGGVDDVLDGEKEGTNRDSDVVSVVSAELFLELFSELIFSGTVGEKSNTLILFPTSLISFSATALYSSSSPKS